MLIDSHAHLDAAEFDADRPEMIQHAMAAGVSRFVIPAVEVANFDAVRDLANSLPGSVHAYGIHPLYVRRARESDLATLRMRLEQGGAVALGEIGLDGFVPEISMDLQEYFFVEQLKLARDFDLPVILHVRRSQDLILKHLRRFKPRGGIAHAFNGSRQQADIFIQLGFALGFGGAMTYSGSTRIRELAKTLPLDSIVLESDAPDIPPAWAPKDRNDPANVARFANVLAELREIGLEAVSTATSSNSCRVLRIPA